MHSDATWATTTAPINYPILSLGKESAEAGACLRPGNLATSQGFKSHHHRGANFAFAEASTGFISEDIDYKVLQMLGDYRDGFVITDLEERELHTVINAVVDS